MSAVSCDSRKIDGDRKLFVCEQKFKVSSFTQAFLSADSLGSLDLVKKLYDYGKFSATLLGDAFVGAAENGQLDIVEFLQSKGHIDDEQIGKVLEAAAGCGKFDAVRYLYALQGFKPSPVWVGKAFTAAASGGHLDVVKLLDTKEYIPPATIVKAFGEAAKDGGQPSSYIADPVDVLKFLYATGCITTAEVYKVIPAAAARCCVDVMQFLYARGTVPSMVSDIAFAVAVQANCAAVVSFLCKTETIYALAIEDEFLRAAKTGDIYMLNAIVESGCVPQALVRKASRKVYGTRVEQFLRQRKI